MAQNLTEGNSMSDENKDHYMVIQQTLQEIYSLEARKEE